MATMVVLDWGDAYRVRDFWTRPTIASLLPVRFKPRGRWSKLTMRCTGCGKALADDSLRGQITRESDQSYLVDARGLCCDGCKLLSHYTCRLLADGTIMLKSGESGWTTVHPKPAPEYVCGRCRAVFSRWPGSRCTSCGVFAGCITSIVQR